jgi:hypothetical protein
VPEDRQAGTEQEPGHAGVRAVVHPGRIGRAVEDRHQQGRDQRRAHHDQQQPIWSLAEAGQQEQQDGRPEEVELLLHGERPQVPQQGRTAELVEVRRPTEDEVPVHRVGQRCDEVAAQSRELLVDEQHAHRGDGDEERVDRGQQASTAAEPEPPHADRAVPAVLAEEEHRDQVATDDEEDLDAEEAAPEPRRVAVVDDHRRDRERAQAVQARQVRDRLGVRGRPRNGGVGGDGHRSLVRPAGRAILSRGRPTAAARSRFALAGDVKQS